MVIISSENFLSPPFSPSYAAAVVVVCESEVSMEKEGRMLELTS